MLELLQRWGELLSRLMIRIPQLAVELGLGSWPVAALALLAGVALLLVGIRLGPLLSGVAGAALGWVMVTRHPALAFAWGIPPATQVWVVTAVAGVACAFVPVLYPILLGAAPGAAWGSGLPLLGRSWLGAVAAAVVFGAITFVGRRIVLAATAAIPGALLIDTALLVLSAHFPFLGGLTRRPMLFAAMTAVLVIAGTAAQVSAHPSGGRAGDVSPWRERRARRLRRDQ